MQKIAWIVERKYGDKWEPIIICDNRILCWNAVKYFNGFSHGTKKAINRVGRYVRYYQAQQSNKLSKHRNQLYAEANAETTAKSRKCDARVMLKGKVITFFKGE